MRYTDRIIFVTETAGGYNPDTGRHEDPTRTENTIPCNLSPLGVERAVTLFGDIDKNVIVARLQRPYYEPFDYVEIDRKRMNIKRVMNHRRRTVFYLEGSSL